jgi:hypothetical protein
MSPRSGFKLPPGEDLAAIPLKLQGCGISLSHSSTQFFSLVIVNRPKEPQITGLSSKKRAERAGATPVIDLI